MAKVKSYVLNGPGGQFGFSWNFAYAPGMTAFSANPLDIDVAAFTFPDRYTHNPYTLTYSTYLMTELKLYGPMHQSVVMGPKKTLVVQDEDLEPAAPAASLGSPHHTMGMNFGTRVLDHIKFEIQQLVGSTPGFKQPGLTFQDYFPQSPAGMTRIQYQAYLDENWIYGGEKNLLFRNSFISMSQDGNMVVDMEQIVKDLLDADPPPPNPTDTDFINWVMGNFGPNVALENITVYSARDSYRLSQLIGSTYNMLSMAYGTGQRNWGWPPGQPRAGFFSRLWSGLKKFFPGFIIARGAVLAGVSINVFGWATKMKTGDRAGLRHTWESVGGSWSTLKTKINSGAQKPRLLGNAALGDPTTLAIVAAATPVVLMLLEHVLNSDDYEEAAALVGAAVSSDCQSYLNSMIEFAGAALDDGLDGDYQSMYDAYKGSLPPIPEGCADAINEATTGSDDDDDTETNFNPGYNQFPPGTGSEVESDSSLGILAGIGILALIIGNQ